MPLEEAKRDLRRRLRAALAAMTDDDRRAKSARAAALVADLPEWRAADVVMLYLSAATEVDTAALALKAWQAGKTVAVPKVSWGQRRIMPTEIRSLSDAQVTTGGFGLREPAVVAPVPLGAIDLVLVPGLGFDAAGGRIGRGMGFYDRFLAQPEFAGVSCGLAFAEQVLPIGESLPTAAHDVPLGLLVCDAGVRRFTCYGSLAR